MKQEITFKEMIAHRPLVIAWVWELACIAVALYLILVVENEILGIAAIFAGAVPFVIVFLRFAQARNKAASQPDRSKDLVQ